MIPPKSRLCVASTKEQLNKIEARLAALEHDDLSVPKPSASNLQSYWKKNRRKIWGILVLLLIPTLAIVTPVYREHVKSDFEHSVDDRVNPKLGEVTKQLNEFNTKLTKIDSTLSALQPYIEDLVRRQMDKVASLPLNDFRATLPSIKHLIAVAKEQGVKVNPDLLRRMSDKLLQIKPRDKEFWPFTGELVSYRSFNQSRGGTQQLLTSSLPRCTDAPPTPAKVTSVLSSTTATLSVAMYENCQITLDSSQDDERINATLTNFFPFLTFRHCVISYFGGPVNLILDWKDPSQTTFHLEGHPPMRTKISGNTLQFEECLFSFSIQGVPPTTGQQVTETLLAQNGPRPQLPHP